MSVGWVFEDHARVVVLGSEESEVRMFGFDHAGSREVLGEVRDPLMRCGVESTGYLYAVWMPASRGVKFGKSSWAAWPPRFDAYRKSPPAGCDPSDRKNFVPIAVIPVRDHHKSEAWLLEDLRFHIGDNRFGERCETFDQAHPLVLDWVIAMSSAMHTVGLNLPVWDWAFLRGPTAIHAEVASMEAETDRIFYAFWAEAKGQHRRSHHLDPDARGWESEGVAMLLEGAT